MTTIMPTTIEWKAVKPDLSSLHPFCPDEKDVYKALELCPPDKVKVVLLALSPYQGMYDNGLCVATGIPTAIRQGYLIQPSLEVIREELIRSNLGDIQNCTELTHWCSQGVLSLNCALTVEREGDPKSHLKYWKKFIREILKQADNQKPVVALMGKEAHSFSGAFKQAKVLKVPHPVADKYGNRFAFRGSDVFVIINELLELHGEQKIQWSC